MTRIQKRKLISACLVAGTVILLTSIEVLHYYVRTAHLSDKGYTIYTLGLLAWLVIYLVVIFIINRKKKVVLTSDERRQVLPPQLNLSNKFEWRLLLLTGGILLYGILTLIIDPIARLDTFDLIYWSAFCLLCIVVCVLIFMSLKRNEYLIEGNTLIVREYKFKRLDTDLRIPINTIEQVYIKNHYTFFPRVILEIGGNNRELRCISHPESLAVAILQRTDERK